MEISKKLDYSLCMLSEVARLGEGETLSVRTAAERHGIPYSFARTIQHDLVRSGLLVTTRGPHGGMRLARDARSITLLDVVRNVEGDFLGSDIQSDDIVPSRFELLWRQLDLLLQGFLGSVTLEQLAVDRLMPTVSAGLDIRLTPLPAAKEEGVKEA